MMKRHCAAVVAVGLVCGLALSSSASADQGIAPWSGLSVVAADSSGSLVAQAVPPKAAGALMALVPAPANTASTTGIDPISDNGFQRKFVVNGVPTRVMDAYKKALVRKGWQMSTITSADHGDGGGATLIGTKGAVFGVFDGGGYKNTTYLEVCVWPTRPANPNCHSRR